MNPAEALIGLIAPHRCLSCGDFGKLLCDACLSASVVEPPSRCYRCHALTKQSQVCHKCRPKVGIKHVWVASEYQDIPKQLIHKLKFERAKAAASIIGKSLDQSLPYLPDDILIVHIPTANNRVRIRGYDQAKLIAKSLAKKRGWQYKTLMIRTGKSRQVGSSRLERFKHLEKAFLPVRTSTINGAHILLIDDVTTTGATIEAATKVLKNEGAKTIDVAVFAQA